MGCHAGSVDAGGRRWLSEMCAPLGLLQARGAQWTPVFPNSAPLSGILLVRGPLWVLIVFKPLKTLRKINAFGSWAIFNHLRGILTFFNTFKPPEENQGFPVFGLSRSILRLSSTILRVS